jgi:hypothetical protein
MIRRIARRAGSVASGYVLGRSSGGTGPVELLTPAEIARQASLPPSYTGTVTSVATGTGLTGGPITTSGTISLSTPVSVANGGNGTGTFTDGQLLIGNTTGNTLTKASLTAGTGVTITPGHGSISISATGTGGTATSVGLSLPSGELTVSGSPVTTSGTLTAVWATQSANKIFAGPTTGSAATPAFRSLVGADLPNPSSSSLGGVQSKAAVASNFLTQISTSGVVSQAQPAFTDISGTVAAAQLPNPGASSLGGVESYASVSHQWINQISTSGVPSSTQPAFSDISGSVAATQLPNPSATTLGGIESLAAVASNWINTISTSGVPSATQPAFSDISGTAAVNQGGTGQTTYTNGQLLIGNTTGNTLTKSTLSAGSGVTITNSTGSITIAATGLGGTVTSVGLSLPAELTVSGSPVTTSGTLTAVWATESANKVFAGPTSGAAATPAFRSLVGADLPNPGASSLGGVQSKASVASNFLTAISTSGVVSAAQPAFTDISGSIAATQLPNPSATTLGGIESIASASHKWINSISTSGVPTLTQPASTDLSDIPIPVSSGGTGIASGTSGGVPYYSSTSTIASSALHTQHALTIGGGAAAAPYTLGGLGTTNQVLHGAAAGDPTWSAVDLAADVTGILPSANGGTASAFFTVSGPSSTAKTFTFPNASTTVLTTNAAVTVAQGGTGLASGTSGGVPYFSGSTTIASSGALSANTIIKGGGAGSAPVNSKATDNGSQLTLNYNTASAPAGPTGTIFQIAQVDGSQARFIIDGFGTGSNPNLTFRTARNTAASPSAMQSGDGLGLFSGFGYGATGYSSAARSQIAFFATENWTDTSQGASCVFRATPNGSTTLTEICTMIPGFVYPTADNAVTLGASGNRWQVVYAVTGTINTSGYEAKLIRPGDSISDAELRAVGRVHAKTYQWKDAVAKKGDQARYHIGYVVEDWLEAYETEGLDPWSYAPFCRDVTAVDGVQIEPGEPIPDGEPTYALGLRYDQCLALQIEGLRREVAELKSQLQRKS